MHQRRRESGAVLFVAVLMLALMGVLAIASIEATTRDREAAGYTNRTSTSFYAAEAGVAAAREAVKAVTDPTATVAFPDQGTPTLLGDTSLYDKEGGNLPRYYGDPDFANPIQYRDEVNIGGGFSVETGGFKGTGTLWQINVVGESPDGSTTRLEVMEVVWDYVTGSSY
jgi:hypothetical protein